MSDEQAVYRYDGKNADVFWDQRLCIHIGECGRAKGELFVRGRKPWCQPDLASTDNVMDVCARCPTGALHYKRKDGGPTETPSKDNIVTVTHCGPLYVKGDLKIDGAAQEMEGVAFRAALCRCGASKNKPFCDNSHEQAGFKDYGAVGETGEGTSEQGGELEIKKRPDGPLLLSGNFSIMASSGRVAWKGTKAALCRCGASKNKPFCDGAHREIGFKAP